MIPNLISRASFGGYAVACVLSLSSPRTQIYVPSLNPPEQSTERQTSMEAAARTVREGIASLVREDPTVAGPILRLAFHDAATREDRRPYAPPTKGTRKVPTRHFTGGANGSIQYELDWSENRGLSRPLRAVEVVHEMVSVTGGLSFADTVALSGAAAVEAAGGPRIPIRLGRQDAAGPDPRERRRPIRASTDRSLVSTTLPSAGLDSDGLRLYFGALGLTEEEFVALCGAHDLGRHVTLLGMDKACLKNLTRECLEGAPNLMPFVSESPDTLSNLYFRKLLRWYDRSVELGEVAFIPTDVDLVVDEG